MSGKGVFQAHNDTPALPRNINNVPAGQGGGCVKNGPFKEFVIRHFPLPIIRKLYLADENNILQHVSKLRSRLPNAARTRSNKEQRDNEPRIGLQPAVSEPRYIVLGKLTMKYGPAIRGPDNQLQRHRDLPEHDAG
jgi:hypothetical protein